ALFYFLPIRLKGRTFLLIIIIIRLIPVLLFGFFAPYYILFYLPELGGILASYILFKYEWGLS
ncbi:MAG: hypothetical protein WBH31_07145, partial [Promethearchaeia archaeon]